jgi:branched-chain amino acid transport system ATP-binding protein
MSAEAESAAGLVVRGLNAYYGTHQIIEDLDLTLEAGDGLAIMGRNGVGKTTLMRAIMRAFGVRSEGEISWRGTDLTRMPTDAIARLGVALVPSDRRVFGIPVLENFRLAGRGREGWEELMRQMLTYFPMLADRLSQRADTLSGGEQQALAIARSAMLRPSLMLLDEPSEGLAPLVTAGLAEGLAELKRDWGLSLVIVDRNLELLDGLCSTVQVLVKGRTAHLGPLADFAADDALRHRLLAVDIAPDAPAVV